MKPSLREEKKLWRKGIKRVVCLDEAGRGPLAGPVVAAAVSIIANCKLEILKFKDLKDSKKLAPKKEKIFTKLLQKILKLSGG
jgi:ribonuclease HII